MARIFGHYSNLFDIVKRLNHIWGVSDIVTTAPALADMRVGTVLMGDGTESSPAAGSDALYFKPDAAKIVVIASNGSSLATRHIT